MPFGMPTTVKLKEKLKKFSYADIDEEILYSFVNEYKYPDIEYVLQSLRDIIKFSKSKGGDYFITHGKNGIFPFEKGTVPFDTFINKVVIAESQLEEFVYENYRWKPSSKDKVQKIFDVVFGFLEKNSDSITVFTTNYDRIIEEYCRIRDQFQCIDGFKRKPPYSEISRWTGNFDLENDKDGPKNVYLYKLHGSLNWKEHVEHGIVKTIEEAKSIDSNFNKNLVVMPTLSPKEDEESEPFTTIISKFENYMKTADAGIVIGFSFRDNQLNNTFMKFVKNGKALIVISPSAMERTCENLLHVKVPKDFDKGKVSSLAPDTDNVWCIPDKLDENNMTNDLNVALAHIQKICGNKSS